MGQQQSIPGPRGKQGDPGATGPPGPPGSTFKGDRGLPGPQVNADIVFNNKWTSDTNFDWKKNSQIVNDTGDFKALMIHGNTASGVKNIGLYDNVKVYGDLSAQNNIFFEKDLNVNGKIGNRDNSSFITGWGGYTTGYYKGDGTLNDSVNKLTRDGITLGNGMLCFKDGFCLCNKPGDNLSICDKTGKKLREL